MHVHSMRAYVEVEEHLN